MECRNDSKRQIVAYHSECPAAYFFDLINLPMMRLVYFQINRQKTAASVMEAAVLLLR